MICLLYHNVLFALHTIRYRAVVEKVVSADEVHVFFIDFGNVSASLRFLYSAAIDNMFKPY